jgi:hypothetical protein
MDGTATSTIDESRMIMNPVTQSRASANHRFGSGVVCIVVGLQRCRRPE